MRNVLLVAAAGFLAGGLVFAAWYPSVEHRSTVGPFMAGAQDQPADSLEGRLAALEQALTVERDARQLLEEELLYLSAAVLDRESPRNDRLIGPEEVPAVADNPRSVQQATRRSRTSDPEERQARLVDNGFSPQQAEEILRRESELQMEALQARYEAQRNGERTGTLNPGEALREELGDDAYARYLEANGRQTRVTVSTIYESSPARAAGMLPGDEVVRYDGQRVFSMREIGGLMMEGVAGEAVTLDIMRDGVPMQLSIPRGPLGVAGGRRFRR